MATINYNGQDIWICTEENKEQFQLKAYALAKNYDVLKEFFTKVFRPIIKQYHGKALNNRFMLALQQGALEIDENIIVDNLNRYDDGVSYLRVSTTYPGEGTTLGHLQLCIVEKFADSTERLINSAATMQRNKPWKGDTKEDEIQAMADGCRDAIEHYDEYMQQVAELKQMVDKYNQLSFCFHQHISKNFLQAY